MLGRTVTDSTLPQRNQVRVIADFVGSPLVALLVATLVAMVTLGRGAVHPAGHRLGDGRDHHRSRDRRPARRRPGSGARRAAGAGRRRGLAVLQPCQRRGFWLVKEYFGMTVGQTLRTWSVMETVISVVALVFILLLGWVL